MRLTRRGWLGAGLAATAGAWLPGVGRAVEATRRVHVFGAPPAEAARVFVAGPPAAVLVTVLAPERLLGWPMPLGPTAKAMLPAVVRDKPMLGRLAGRGSTVGMESVLALHPDLILDVGTVDDTYLSTARSVSEQTGLPYLLVDGRLADTPAQLLEVGRRLGVEARAAELAGRAEETLRQASALRSDASRRPPGVYLARGADGLETATAGSINGEFIEAAGGRNVADTGHAGVGRVSMEQVLQWAPDWVVTQDRQFFRHAQADPLWKTLPAVREDRLVLMPDQPFGWIDGPPGVNRLPGVRWLAAAWRTGQPPGRRTLDNALDEALRFHALFYGAAPSREAVQAMLDGRG